MQQVFCCKQFNKAQSSGKAFLAHVIVITAVAFACGSGYAQADSSALGSYAGTIIVSGTETDPDVSYRARVKVSLPISERNDTSVSAKKRGRSDLIFTNHLLAYNPDFATLNPGYIC
jgi:hypothetical protein